VRSKNYSYATAYATSLRPSDLRRRLFFFLPSAKDELPPSFLLFCPLCFLSPLLSLQVLLLLQPFNGLFSRTTWVSRYQIGKTSLEFTGARDIEWQWHQLGHMQVCTSLQTDNHASTPPLCFLQAVCPSCRPTNSVKALKALSCL